MVRLMLSFALAFSIGRIPAHAADGPADAAGCLISAWNRHDWAAANRCYTDDAVTVRNGSASPLDRDAERGYREFEAAANARFTYTVDASGPDSVEIALREESDFLRALGVATLAARWRFVTRGGLIAEEHHLNKPYPRFTAAFRQFAEWLQTERPLIWKAVVDSDGDIVFSKSTGSLLVKSAQEWQRSGRPSHAASAHS